MHLAHTIALFCLISRKNGKKSAIWQSIHDQFGFYNKKFKELAEQLDLCYKHLSVDSIIINKLWYNILFFQKKTCNTPLYCQSDNKSCTNRLFNSFPESKVSAC